MTTESSLDWSKVSGVLGDRGIILIGRPKDEFRSLARVIEKNLGKSLHIIANEHSWTGDADRGSVALGYTSPTGIFHALHSVLTDPPPAVVAQLAGFDPRRRALVISDSNVVAPAFDGRRVLDSRSQELARLEYPGAVTEVWRRAGLVTTPTREVLAPFNDLSQACADIDMGYGVLCFGDRRLPVQEALESVRVVRDPVGAGQASAWLHLTSERAVVQPMLPGVPVATSGMVIGERVVTLRPQEEGLVFDRSSGALWHASCSTLALSGQDEETLRRTAIQVGAVLREHHSFQGAFSVGGWLRRGAFTPSRLTTRTTRAHRHAIGAGIGASWSVVNALAVGRVLQEADIEGTGFRAHAALRERRSVSMGLSTHANPGRRVVGKWLVVKPDGRVCESRDRTPSCLLWLSTQDGGIITGLGLEEIFRGARHADRLAELLSLATSWWPGAGLHGVSPVCSGQSY
ncbi:hypothetical protein OHT76_05620 [Streptomyces sp. NBC_00287]|uniref:hypothetical protein n=1 Tax=Streptomyces sp. NBC_00287 TaxID=2975702 RepID=UPI002E2A2183|nr:hypothetical protein [Streptomyces sp. NBC_00287]